MKHCFYTKETGTVFYNLQRVQKETIEVAVLIGGQVRVRAPKQMSESAIRRFLKEKASWIQEQKTRQKEEKEAWMHTKFQDGNAFYYLGGSLTLMPGESSGVPVWKAGNLLMIDRKLCSPHQRKEYLEKWYRKQAKRYIENRVRFFAGMVGEVPNKVTIKTQRRRWGSCSSLRNLNFNWKLIMMPQEVIDYVVVHELCHLKEMNHSISFWNQVESILPDYRKCKEWLKNNAWKVEWEQI